MKYTVPGYTSWCLTVGPSGTCQVAQSLHPWTLPEKFYLEKYPHDYLAKAVGIATLVWQLHISRTEKI